MLLLLFSELLVVLLELYFYFLFIIFYYLLSSVSVIFKINQSKKFVYCEASASTKGQTGVEMEALTAVQIGLLTIYDMCKSIDRSMIITDIQLESKKGGASGEWKRAK